jgi:hypothetical protein
MDEVIRIPVTAEQKRLIKEAAGIASSSGVASWARDTLLRAAQPGKRRGKNTGE